MPGWNTAGGSRPWAGSSRCGTRRGTARATCCFFQAEGKSAFVGDTLFNGGIGRTDFPGCSFTELERSIREQIYTLPDDTIVFPGHGERTTVGAEKETNPYVAASRAMSEAQHESFMRRCHGPSAHGLGHDAPEPDGRHHAHCRGWRSRG